MGSPQSPLDITIDLHKYLEEYDFKTSNWCECKNICWHHLFKKKKSCMQQKALYKLFFFFSFFGTFVSVTNFYMKFSAEKGLSLDYNLEAATCCACFC